MAAVAMDEESAGRRRRLSSARWAVVFVAGAVLAGVYFSGAWRYLSLESLAAHRLGLKAWVAGHPLLAVSAFIGLYALVVLASVPGATVLTLAGGLVFGVWLGAAATLVGASAGAVGVYALARSFLAGPLARRAEAQGGALQRLTDGFRRDAFFFLLSLRLMPAVPFWLVNIAAGLGRASPPAFVAATLLGMAPATLIYSAIGAGLDRTFASGRTPELSSLLKPELLLPLVGLAALSLAPVLYRRARRRTGARHD